MNPLFDLNVVNRLIHLHISVIFAILFLEMEHLSVPSRYGDPIPGPIQDKGNP